LQCTKAVSFAMPDSIKKRTRWDIDTSSTKELNPVIQNDIVSSSAKKLNPVIQNLPDIETLERKDQEFLKYVKFRRIKHQEFNPASFKADTNGEICPIEEMSLPGHKSCPAVNSKLGCTVSETETPSPHLKTNNIEKPLWSISNHTKKIRMNFSNLLIPERLPGLEESSLRELQSLLIEHGYEIHDRATLAFFAIGKSLDVQSAAECFLRIHNLVVNNKVFTSPDRVRMQHMKSNGFVEGFANHYDGSFGWLLKVAGWNCAYHDSAYVFRELLCYIFKLINLPFLRQGFTIVINCRDLTWRCFAPYEKANCIASWYHLPMKLRTRYLIDLGSYGRIAHKVLSTLLPSSVMKSTVVLPLNLVRERYPDIVLPPSLTRSTINNRIEKLSVDEQFNFRFFVD